MTEDLIQINDKIFVIYQYCDKDEYKYRVTNSAGQTVELCISDFYTDQVEKRKFWTVLLYVNKKSRGYEFGKSTGKAGMESLLIAKEMLKYHIEYIRSCYKFYYKTYIYIWGDDKKRMNVYQRGLRDLGFVLTNETWGKKYKSGKCLLRII